jgi:hydroxyacylglutathione hydrolase
MPQEIKIIDTGGVNCYLLKAGSGDFTLVDTGFASKRAVLERGLQSAGCAPGSLRLIILTHGDSDHTGNSAYLREKYGAKIGMHPADMGMVEHGDMSWNRKAKPDRVAWFFRLIMLLTGRPAEVDLFTPDVALEDGAELAGYGLDARVLHLPGHSMGSIGILTAGGDLFCGDLVWNIGKLSFHFADDLTAAYASIEKINRMDVRTIYPGHGKPFSAERLVKSRL